MTIHRRHMKLLLLGLLALSSLAQADVIYAVKPVGVAGSTPAGINNRGQIVGSFTDQGVSRGFLYSAGGFVDLGTLGGSYSRASGVNDEGAVVGTAEDTAGNLRAFLYVNGNMRDIGTLGGANSRASAINNKGQIAGVADSDEGSFAFLYTEGLGMKNLGTLQGGVASRAEGINNAGTVVGGSMVGEFPLPQFHAFAYTSGVMTDLDSTLSSFSIGQAINDQGQVVGWANAGFGIDHAFLYSSGVMTDLSTLSGFGSSGAYDINNAGDIVGWSEVANRETRAILYQDGMMIDLETLIDPSLGWTLEAAYSINDLQQIAAYGCQGNVCQALLLDPVAAIPEPRTSLLLMVGLGLMGWPLRGRQRIRGRAAQ